MKLKKKLLLFAAATILAANAFAQDSFSENTVITSSDINWGHLNPKRGDASPRAADLYGNRLEDVPTGMLVKFAEGFASPPHIHNITYRAVVIDGLLHNDDPDAASMWLGPGSFWTQPAGADHITSSNTKSALIYLEIDSGPYLVQPSNMHFDNGEAPINIDKKNLVWLDDADAEWVKSGDAEIAYLWGDLKGDNGSFLRLPANFKGFIKDETPMHGVVVTGDMAYRWENDKEVKRLEASNFFSSEIKGKHFIQTGKEEVTIYMRSLGSYEIIQTN